jgi:hypothetical protein
MPVENLRVKDVADWGLMCTYRFYHHLLHPVQIVVPKMVQSRLVFTSKGRSLIRLGTEFTKKRCFVS